MLWKLLHGAGYHQAHVGKFHGEVAAGPEAYGVDLRLAARINDRPAGLIGEESVVMDLGAGAWHASDPHDFLVCQAELVVVDPDLIAGDAGAVVAAPPAVHVECLGPAAAGMFQHDIVAGFVRLHRRTLAAIEWR